MTVMERADPLAEAKAEIEALREQHTDLLIRLRTMEAVCLKLRAVLVVFREEARIALEEE